MNWIKEAEVDITGQVERFNGLMKKFNEEYYELIGVVSQTDDIEGARKQFNLDSKLRHLQETIPAIQAISTAIARDFEKEILNAESKLTNANKQMDEAIKKSKKEK